jgi:hypothetical protein
MSGSTMTRTAFRLVWARCVNACEYTEPNGGTQSPPDKRGRNDLVTATTCLGTRRLRLTFPASSYD